MQKTAWRLSATKLTTTTTWSSNSACARRKWKATRSEMPCHAARALGHLPKPSPKPIVCSGFTRRARCSCQDATGALAGASRDVYVDRERRRRLQWASCPLLANFPTRGGAGAREVEGLMACAMRRTLAVPLLVAAASSTQYPHQQHYQQEQQRCGAQLKGVDLNGNDVQPACSAKAPSAADCCAQCAAALHCKAYTWIARSAGGECCFKTSAAGRRSVAGHVSGCLLASGAGSSSNCSAAPPGPPPVPGPPPPPLPPPSPPPIPWGTPPLPSWSPTYNMSLSTAIEPCNYSGFFDLDFASRFGYVDWGEKKIMPPCRPR
jgi:hypothetical protein